MQFITFCLFTALTLTNALPSSFNAEKANMLSPFHVSTIKDSFTCTGSGYFPDPSNCSKVIQCVIDHTAGFTGRYERNCPSDANVWCQSRLNCVGESECPEGCSNTTSSSTEANDRQSDQHVLTSGHIAESPCFPSSNENLDYNFTIEAYLDGASDNRTTVGLNHSHPCTDDVALILGPATPTYFTLRNGCLKPNNTDPNEMAYQVTSIGNASEAPRSIGLGPATDDCWPMRWYEDESNNNMTYLVPNNGTSPGECACFSCECDIVIDPVSQAI